MGSKGGSGGGGRGGPKGGMPRGGKFGAGHIRGPQVQANLNNHANMQNPTSPVYQGPKGSEPIGGGGDNEPTPEQVRSAGEIAAAASEVQHDGMRAFDAGYPAHSCPYTDWWRRQEWEQGYQAASDSFNGYDDYD
jgi:hypothetical protein